MEIHGVYDPKFGEVREAFEQNFHERGEVGASVCVVVEGETVVDLWGGIADPKTAAPWQEDTITVVMSMTKGATALCAHILVDRGELDIDQPVAHYWPEFAQNGKERIPVRMLLNHQAGLPGFHEPIPAGKPYDWEYMVARLAAERPFWEPGRQYGYHSVTFGWLVGEVVRRVSGKSLGTFFREEVAEPLGLDFWIGLPESEERRAVRLLPRLEPSPEVLGIPELRAERVSNGVDEPGDWWNTRNAHAAELPASGGITNARAAARMYAALSLGGTLDGVRLVSPETVERMSRVQSALMGDALDDITAPFALGFMQASPSSGFPRTRFGHEGAGGSNGFADPAARLAFGYVMNQMSETPRADVLTAATYRSLGYRAGKYGVWMPRAGL
jgi:CubicO group peptidase (beta-lactamase class C family)